MRYLAFFIAILSGFAVAQERMPKDPCGSLEEFVTKRILDMCYKEYFDAIVDTKRRVHKLEKEVEDLGRKLRDTEDVLKRLEKRAEDQEKKLESLESTSEDLRKMVEELKLQGINLEEVGRVYFAFNKFKLTSAEEKKLKDIAEKIKEGYKEVIVVGFADRRGGSRYNFNLSMWRAQMTASHLVRHGVDANRIRIVAYGKELVDLIGSQPNQQRVAVVYRIK